MVPIVKRCLPFGLIAAVSVWLAFSNPVIGDYENDGGLAVQALARGDVAAYLSTHVMMGPFSTLVQAPFAALSGSGELAAYQWACLPCLFAVGLLGLYLASIGRRRGMPALGCWLLAGLCLVNPLTFAALETGHPEELLTAALAVGAVVVASQGRPGWTALLLGLAIASKQWAVIAILPALMALPRRRIRVALGAAAISLLLFLPGFIASPSAFSEVQHSAASTGRVVDPWSVWYPLASVTVVESTIGSTRYSAEVHRAPELVGSLSHPLIVLLVFALPLALALRRRQFSISGTDALALLALLALLRCALDPVSNLYYHEPLLLALIAWDALEGRRWPLRAAAGVAVALFFEHWSWNLSSLMAFNAAYSAMALGVATALVVVLFRPGWGRRNVRRELDVRLSPAS